MRKVNKSKATRLIIQAVSAGFGIFGLTEVYLGIYFAVIGIRESDLFAMFFMTPMFLILGGIVAAIAWQALRRFGPTAIKNMVALVALSAYIAVSTFLDRFEEAARAKGDLYFSAMSLIPLLLAYVLYRVLSRKLIKMAGMDTSDNGQSPAVDRPGHDSTSI